MFYRFIITPITYYVNRVLFLFLFSFKEMIFQHLLTLFHIFLIIMTIITIGFKRGVLHACPNHFIRAKVRITKSEISMRTWRSPMSAASQGAFVVIPEISHSDISYIIKIKRHRTSKFVRCRFFLPRAVSCDRDARLFIHLYSSSSTAGSSSSPGSGSG